MADICMSKCSVIDDSVADMKNNLQNLQTQLNMLEQKVDVLHSLYEQEKIKRVTLEKTVDELKLYLPTNKVWKGVNDQESLLIEKCDKEKESTETIADMLKKTAEEVLQNTGYVYDEKTRLYYDQASGLHYDPEQALYYDSRTGTYYSYDNEKNSYVFHSQVDLAALSLQYKSALPQEAVKTKKMKKKTKKIAKPKGDETLQVTDSKISSSCDMASEDNNCGSVSNEDKSDGECSSTESSSSSEEASSVDDGLERPKSDDVLNQFKSDDISVSPARCIRAMVTSSDVLPIGYLQVVTFLGIMIGRDSASSGSKLTIPDILLSREHCSIYYNDVQQKYLVADCGSQNGTFVNGYRVVQGSDLLLNHGDVLQLGTTQFELHIHPGLVTCEGCEPGEVQARFKCTASASEKLSKSEKETSRRKILKNIRRKYGLENMAYADGCRLGSNYTDRAQQRRCEVGIDYSTATLDDEPASVDRAIASDNVGHKLMARMGWKEGDSLGKSQQGIKEPIKVILRGSKSAGLGSSVGGPSQPIDETIKWNKARKWSKAQERFSKIENAGQSRSKVTKTARSWVKGQSQDDLHQEHLLDDECI